jgi:acetyltransferase-like isoleucine patch superfamily enzyme
MNPLVKILRAASQRLFGKPPVPFYTADALRHHSHVEIGDHTYGCPNVLDFGEGTRLRVGKYCSIASGVTIMLGGNHRIDWITTYPFPALASRWPGASAISGHPQSKGDVSIGNDVWLATDALVLSGVTIGDGAVVAARAVVAKDVPPYAIAAGNPARVTKTRFSDDQVRILLALRWWDWPDDAVAKAVPLLCGGNVDLLKNFASAEGLAPPADALAGKETGPTLK